MLHHRPFLVRFILACALALIALAMVGTMPRHATAHDAETPAARISTPITPALPIDLGTFNDSGVNSLPGVEFGSASWGDCNNDGAADVLLIGQVSPTLNIARVYRQQINGSFALDAVLTGVIYGAAAWGDYDNDGWLDIALTGDSANGPISQIWHNERNGTTCAFSLVATNLIGVDHSTVAWGDYNADGQPDLLIAGNDGSQPVTRIYRNDHGVFTNSGLNLPGIQDGAAIWGDYDSDGFVDLLLTGSAAGGAPLTSLYHNDGHGGLINIQTGLPALGNSAAAWGDYDNDGQIDLLVEGTTITPTHIAEIYHNNHGTFAKNNAASNLLGSLDWTGAAWGDFDTDGYLDALISSNGLAMAYHNEMTGSFAAGISVGTSGLAAGSAAWGHYDNDRNLDVVVTGQSLSGRIAKIFKYSKYTPNPAPSAPTKLTTSIEGTNATLSWSPPITPDDYTPNTGLSYNFRLGTQPGGIDIVAPMAITSTGYRLLPALGNAYSSLSVTLHGLPLGQPLYWSVQAIDTSFIGSNFADEGVFRIPYKIFLPMLMKNDVGFYTAEWESEPNDSYLQANGALISGQIYRGLHDDTKDYYSVYLQAGGTIDVNMTSPNGGTQLQLFYQVADVAHRVGFDPMSPYNISYSGSPGWYYIYVFTNPAFVGTQAYTLTATYP